MCLCVSITAPTSERRYPRSSLMVCRYIIIFRSVSYIKIIGSRSGAQEQKKRVCVYLFSSNLPSIGRQSYVDCETIRIPPLMSKRTIRIPGEGGRRRRRGVDGTLGGPSSQKKAS